MKIDPCNRCNHRGSAPKKWNKSKNYYFWRKTWQKTKCYQNVQKKIGKIESQICTIFKKMNTMDDIKDIATKLSVLMERNEIDNIK